MSGPERTILELYSQSGLYGADWMESGLKGELTTTRSQQYFLGRKRQGTASESV